MPSETQIELAIKIGQGQHRVMFYMNFVLLQSLMLHAKFQGNWPSVSGEKDVRDFDKGD